MFKLNILKCGFIVKNIITSFFLIDFYCNEYFSLEMNNFIQLQGLPVTSSEIEIDKNKTLK